ncbi:MAG: hypothetical protein ACFBSF_10185 [Leptolyngbyaceae cyanobacterium]
MNTRYGYARFTVIVYTTHQKNLPTRPTLNYFEWNAPEPKAAHGIIDEDLSTGYHRHQVIAYACKLQPRVTDHNRDLAISV